MSISVDKCFTFINCQIKPQPSEPGLHLPSNQFRAVTISRQSGSGAHEVAEHLARLLQEKIPAPNCPWTVFDRNLVEKVLEDHHLPQRLSQFMPEDRVSYFADTIDELFGLHPNTDELNRRSAETILRLAHLGGVILIGRGSNVITAKLNYVFHVRLVAPLGTRVKYLQSRNGMSEKAARELVEREDRGRARFLKTHYAAHIDDPLLYNLVINTGCIDPLSAARLIVYAISQARPAPIAKDHALQVSEIA